MNKNNHINLYNSPAYHRLQVRIPMFLYADATPGPDTSWQPTITATMPVIELRNSLLLPAFTDSVEISSNTATLNTPIGMQVIFPPIAA